MKVLFISEKLPYPLDTGGNIRTFHILRGLCKKHEVTLLCTVENREQYKYIEQLQSVCERVIPVDIDKPNRIKLAKDILCGLFTNTPIVILRHYYHKVALRITQLISKYKYDVVHFNHLDATAYMAHIPGDTITVLDDHNIVSNQLRTHAYAGKNICKRLCMLYEFRKTLRYEQMIAEKMSLCLVCSNKDKSYLSEMAGTARIAVVPNGVDLEYFSALKSNEIYNRGANHNGDSLVFVGTMDYGPCETAVHFFSTEILPLIVQKIPDIRFLVVGRNPSRRLQKLAAGHPNIELTGYVPDVRPHVATAKVFVVPLLSGSGTRLKILDAMAMGIPVVSTEIGAEGLDVEHGMNILLADSAKGFSSAVIDLLENPALAESIKNEGEVLVKAKYGWESICKNLLNLYDSLPGH